GWAIVENATDEDWNQVSLGLISGRPISFQMDLYEPLYVPRPMVEPELFASLRPQTYSGNMDEKQLRLGRAPKEPAAPPRAETSAGARARSLTEERERLQSLGGFPREADKAKDLNFRQGVA